MDVLLFQTVDDGDITVRDGIVDMTIGLETAVYLSLFGGNQDDNGLTDSSATWWGNIDENREAYQYRSETANLLESLPAIPANLLRVEEAVKRDTSWLVSGDYAASVTVTASMPSLNRIQIDVDIDASSYTFASEWGAQ